MPPGWLQKVRNRCQAVLAARHIRAPGSEPFFAPPALDPARVLILVLAPQTGRAVVGEIESARRRRGDRVEQLASRSLELPSGLRRGHRAPQLVSGGIEVLVLLLGHLPCRVVARRDALDLVRANVVPQREMGEVVFRRPTIVGSDICSSVSPSMASSSFTRDSR